MKRIGSLIKILLAASGFLYSTLGLALEIKNIGTEEVRFDLTVNNRTFLRSDSDIVAEIKENGEGEFPLDTWSWLIDNTYHFEPFTGNAWQHAPVIYTNSLGFGFCDDTASIFYSVMTAAGYKARVWGLNGHVVPEVMNKGRWEIYDADLKALYVDHNGEIVGYHDIKNGYDFKKSFLNMKNSKYSQFLKKTDTKYWRWNFSNFEFLPSAYSEYLEEIYSNAPSESPNEFYMRTYPTHQNSGYLFNLPKNGVLRIYDGQNNEIYSEGGSRVPDYAILEIEFGETHGFEVNYPLIPIEITGEGTVSFQNMNFEIGGEELNSLVKSRGVLLSPLVVNTTGNSNKIRYLLNKKRFLPNGFANISVVANRQDFIDFNLNQ